MFLAKTFQTICKLTRKLNHFIDVLLVRIDLKIPSGQQSISVSNTIKRFINGSQTCINISIGQSKQFKANLNARNRSCCVMSLANDHYSHISTRLINGFVWIIRRCQDAVKDVNFEGEESQ